MGKDYSWHPKQKPFNWRPARHTWVKNAIRFRVPFKHRVYLEIKSTRRDLMIQRQKSLESRYLICPWGQK